MQTRFLAIDSGGFAAPGFFDVTTDGIHGLLVRKQHQQHPIFTTQGQVNIRDIWEFAPNILHLRRFGVGLQRLVFTFGDLDGDGDPDLIMGDHSGRLLWFRNSGWATVPARETTADNLLPDSTRADAAPHQADLDGDGDIDMPVGVSDGELFYLRNNGSPSAPEWIQITDRLADYDRTRHPAPQFTDLDGDGTLDLLLGNEEGLVMLFQGILHSGGLTLSPVPAPISRGTVGRNASPAVADLNGDSKPDLLVGDFAGHLIVFLHTDAGNEQRPEFRLSERNYLGKDVGIAAAPFVGDIDLEDTPDLLIGSDNGSLQFFTMAEKIQENP